MKTLGIAAVFLVASTAAAQAVPDFKPGDTCERLRTSYGNEFSVEGPAHIWKQSGITVRVLVKPNGPCVAGLVEYSTDPGHTYRTRDGIILGKDTIAEARRKLQGRIDDNSYMSIRGAGKAYGQLVVSAYPGDPFKGTYSWQLNQAAAQRLNGPPKLADFTNEPVIAYSIEAPDPQ